MKINEELKKLSFFFALFCIPSVTFALPEKDEGNLGEIRQSILSEKDFQRIYGEEWVLMDGRNIKSSDLFRENLWKKKTIPNALGVFLRCKNYDRKLDQGNSAGDLEIGFRQPDQILRHGHGLRLECGPNSCHHNACLSQPPGSQYNYVNGNGRYPHFSAHETISETGDLETCPRNITVNTFIKINRTKKNQFKDTLLNEIASIPDRIRNNDQFKNAIDAYIKLAIDQELNNRGLQAK